MLPDGLAVDVHWHIIVDRRRRQFGLSTDSQLGRRITTVMEGANIPMLGPIDQLVHLFVHGCMSGGHRLQWSLDLWFAAPQPLPVHGPMRS